MCVERTCNGGTIHDTFLYHQGVGVILVIQLQPQPGDCMEIQVPKFDDDVNLRVIPPTVMTQLPDVTVYSCVQELRLRVNHPV